ncbi:hypothetical protein ACNUDN_11825 [Mycobacterium sp. smrl_JER01]|uniref:hypothetical protein n=1 Tax=Mycobacterium sp. smrl_JER01 TaxID=3402633 RepID=UPI003AC456F8
MSAPTTAVDPASQPRQVWAARLGYLKSRGHADDHPDVVTCREALAYYRISKSVAAETGHLSGPGADRLVAQLRQAVAR